MHVGRKQILCPDLFIDNWKVESSDTFTTGIAGMVDVHAGTSKIESSDAEKYLGDVISKDGKNTKNIEARKSKGIGVVNQIMCILNDIIFGPYHFEVALILRKSLLLSSLLTNSEAWYGMSLAEIEQIEQVDEMLLRKILEAGKSCPKEMLYLELGCTPIRFIIMQRRIMFLNYILNENKESLVYRVLEEQIRNPSKNDWILNVQKNLKSLDIHLSIEDIQNIKKEPLRKFVVDKIEEKSYQFLNEKKLKHSKVSHINHKELKIQDYLKPENIKDNQLAKFLFSARCRMIDCRKNFPNKHKNELSCPLPGCEQDDTQVHLLNCDKLPTQCVNQTNAEVVYENLFSNQVETQLIVASILQERMKQRKLLVK